MYSRTQNGYVLVITKATHKTDSGRKGIDGKPIMIDTVFNPMQYVKQYARVMCLPIDMGNAPIAQKTVGYPGYGPIRRPPNREEACSMDLYAIGGVYEYKWMNDIVPEVEMNDRIYFKKHMLNKPMYQMGVLLNEDKQPEKYIYRVPYDSIFCAVRGNTIIPIGSWVLLDPIYEDWDEVYQKTYTEFTTDDGARIPKPKKDWIKLKAAPAVDNMRATVMHIGTPLKGEPCDIRRGDVVLFKKMKSVHLVDIEGKAYLALQQDQIIGKLNERVKLS